MEEKRKKKEEEEKKEKEKEEEEEKKEKEKEKEEEKKMQSLVSNIIYYSCDEICRLNRRFFSIAGKGTKFHREFKRTEEC